MRPISSCGSSKGLRSINRSRETGLELRENNSVLGDERDEQILVLLLTLVGKGEENLLNPHLVTLFLSVKQKTKTTGRKEVVNKRFRERTEAAVAPDGNERETQIASFHLSVRTQSFQS